MGRNAKPRTKTYKPRNVKIPPLFNVLMIGDEEPMLAYRIYAGIYSFLHEPTIAASNHLGALLTQIAESLSIMRLAREGKSGLGDLRDPAAMAVVSAIRAFIDISARFDEFGVMQVRETEATTLKNVAGRLDEALRTIPVTIWHEAGHKMKVDEAKVTEFLLTAWRTVQQEQAQNAEAALAA